jgi:hypothetical protein
MAGGASPNPSAFTTRAPDYAGQYGDTPDWGTPNNAYAAPDVHTDAPYNDEFGWAARTRISVESTPDAMREMEFPVRYNVPHNGTPPTAFYRPLDADEKARESETDQDGNGWLIRKNWKPVNRNNPRETPPPETRPTERMGPTTYSFTRPFDQLNRGNSQDGEIGSARHLNGMHFSMADHRREYEILGMQPWGRHRNTYRIDPAPWDADMYDVPPADTIGVQTHARIQAVDIPEQFGNRSYRLG